jgi:predicted oxidoreductase
MENKVQNLIINEENNIKFNLLQKELNDKLVINEENVSIAQKNFKKDSFTQTINFKKLDDYFEEIIGEINPIIENDILIIAHTVIAKYKNKTYILDNTYNNINEITKHLNLGNEVILYAPKMDDNGIIYASILL